jgi:glycosyltransferase involved in cell wall biosynthesis
MPVWKPRLDWFHAAVHSALEQRGCEFELLIIDDGSPEPIADLLMGLEDARMRVVRIEHSGLSRARNAGTAEARGDHVRFVDADDVLEPYSSARLSRMIGADENVFAYGASLVCDEKLRPVWKMSCRREGDVEVDSLLGRLMVRPHGVMFHRRVLEATGEWRPELEPAEDWDFITRAAEHARVRGEQRVAVYYRRHGDSITREANGEAKAERAARRVVEEYFVRHPEQRGTRLELLAKARLHAIAARRHATQGRGREALPQLREALLLDPRSVVHELALGMPALLGRVKYGRLLEMRRPSLSPGPPRRA